MREDPVRMREVAASAGESLPRVTDRPYPRRGNITRDYIATVDLDRGLFVPAENPGARDLIEWVFSEDYLFR